MRTFAIIKSPKLSPSGKVRIVYKTRTDSPKKAARRYAKSICRPRAKKAKSPYCKYHVHVLDMNKIHSPKPLVRKYDVITYKFPKVRPVDIGSVIIPTKARWTVKYNTSFRLPPNFNMTNTQRSNWSFTH